MQRGHRTGHLPTYELSTPADADVCWFAGLGGPAVRAITYPRSSAFTPLVPLDYPTPVVSRMNRARLLRGGRPSRLRLRRAYHTTQKQSNQSGTGIPNKPRPLLEARKTPKWHPPRHPVLKSPNPNPVLAPPALELHTRPTDTRPDPHSKAAQRAAKTLQREGASRRGRGLDS